MPCPVTHPAFERRRWRGGGTDTFSDDLEMRVSASIFMPEGLAFQLVFREREKKVMSFIKQPNRLAKGMLTLLALEQIHLL